MSLINQIILLQEVDNKLFEIEKLLGDLPAKVKELTQNEDDVKTSLLNKENELKETSILISTNETLVETTSEKINSLKDKLIDGSISTNKEYDAMMETIDFEKNLLTEKENALVARLKRAREEGIDPDELRDEEEEGGFKKEVYWVKHAGENELDIPMFLRPTSETAMYTMFPLWIRSHKDLPLKIYQMVNTFRYETKQTRSFIRVREIHFFEAHTAHIDEEDASRQIAEDLEIVDRLMHKLCLPIIFKSL